MLFRLDIQSKLMLFLNEIFLEKNFVEKNKIFQSSVHIVKSINIETQKKINKYFLKVSPKK